MGFVDDYFGRLENSDSTLKPYVDKVISTYESGDIYELQYVLSQFISLSSKSGNGNLITRYSQKDKLCEVYNLCLKYDWINDSDIREVWSENAFYCIAECFKNIQTQQDFFAFSLDLFLTCYYGRDSLKTKFEDILRKTKNHPFYCTIFSQEEYERGADYLIREFAYFSATAISPIVKKYPNMISLQMKSSYESAVNDFEFLHIEADEILQKITHISTIIGYVIDDF